LTLAIPPTDSLFNLPATNEEEWIDLPHVAQDIAAYHEAGHAVIGVLMDFELDSVTIDPGEGMSMDGYSATTNAPSREKGSGEEQLRRRAVYILAGEMAEKKFDPVRANQLDWQGDREELAFLKLDGILALKAEAEKLVKDNWTAIEAVARALLDRKTLTGLQVKFLVVRNSA